MTPGTTRALLALTLSLMTGVASASAEPRRLYQTPDRWLTVEAGRLGVTRFLPDGPQGERNFGATTDPQGVFALINAGLKDTLDGLGLFVDPTPDCIDQATTNLTSVRGYAFTCRYRLLEGPPPIAPPPPPPPPTARAEAPTDQGPTAPPAPSVKPTVTAAKASKPATAPAPAPTTAAAPATAPALPPVALPAATPPATAPTAAGALSAPTPEADADQLNAKVKAAIDAAEARDRQKQSDYEAAKQKAADDFAKQMAEHDARVKAQKAEYEARLNAQKAEYDATMNAWRTRVAACKAGDTSQCADSAIPPPKPK